MKVRLAILAGAVMLLAALFSPSVARISAAPRAQSTVAPTTEPTKPPYVFSTPVFIPIFPDDTPTPRGTPARPGVPPAGQTTYTIQSGDSPWTIAQKVYGDGSKYRFIMDANGLTDQTKLRVGQVLVIPTLAGTAAPTVGAPTVVPPTPGIPPTINAPAPAPTFTPPTPIPTPIPPSPISAMVDALPTIVNVLSGVLFIASLICAILAAMSYDRARRLNAIEARAKIRIR
jgi:LysM repeat protein